MAHSFPTRRSSDLDRALTDFDAAIKYNPSLATAYGNRGYLYHRKRDMTRALADYSAGIKLEPNDILRYIDRGNVYRSMKNLDRAAADYGEAIRVAPRDRKSTRLNSCHAITSRMPSSA